MRRNHSDIWQEVFSKAIVRSTCLTRVVGLLAALGVAPALADEGCVSKLDPYVVWRGVDGPTGAELFVKQKYLELGSSKELYNWLKCQGFRLTVFSGPFGTTLKAGDKEINAAFLVGDHRSGPLWDSGTLASIYSHSIVAVVNSEDKLTFVEVGNTVE
jgi:hypothetical protein